MPSKEEKFVQPYPNFISLFSQQSHLSQSHLSQPQNHLSQPQSQQLQENLKQIVAMDLSKLNPATLIQLTSLIQQQNEQMQNQMNFQFGSKENTNQYQQQQILEEVVDFSIPEKDVLLRLPNKECMSTEICKKRKSNSWKFFKNILM